MTSPASVSELTLPDNERSRLATSIMSALRFAGSVTDFLIHEGQPVRVKSARGVVSLHDLRVPGADFNVTPNDIKNFAGTYLDGISPRASANDHWRDVIEPELVAKKEVHRSLALTESSSRMFLRVSIFTHQRTHLGMVCRLVTPPPPLEKIGLSPMIFDRIRKNPRGLLILTGPTGSGKTSTALSILNYINQTSHGHIVTIEDPIEYVLEPNKCVITQREVGSDVGSFGDGLVDAMRHAPEAILASEIRDKDAAEAGILGAESGALMLVTTHGRSIIGTLRKILALCGENATAMRTVLASGLIGVIRQDLAPLVDGSGYALLQETLHATDQVVQALAAGDWRVLEAIVKKETVTPDFIPMHPRLRELLQARKIDINVQDRVRSAAALG